MEALYCAELRWSVGVPTRMRAAVLHFMMVTIPLHGLILKHIVHYCGIIEHDQAAYSTVEEALVTAVTPEPCRPTWLPATSLTTAALGCKLRTKCSGRNLERAAHLVSQDEHFIIN